MNMRNKLLKMRTLLSKVFLHEPYYLDATLACFASRAHICLLGFRGGGKTHLMECILKTIEPKITCVAQGYLSAEIEDIFARPDISKLTQGIEEVVFKKMVKARVKAFDEIQRLGVGALSSMFRLMTTGTIIYMDKESGVKPFWIIATANPTELSNDTLNIRLPEPLWDRFDAVLWIPIAKLKYLRKINGQIEKLKEALPTLWSENDLLQLWSEVESIKVPKDIELIITLMCRIMGYCKYAQDFDASSLTEEQKRELCSKCSRNYTCSLIARPPSVRAKMSLIRFTKDFAYLRGSNQVEQIDVENAFPIVFWKRVKLMEDEQISNRLEALKDLFDKLKTEIMEVKEGIQLINKLKQRFDEDDYQRLKGFENAKGWFTEVVEELEDYYKELRDKLMSKFEKANEVTKAKIYLIAKSKLPKEYANEFYFDANVKVKLNTKMLAKIAKIDKNLFKMLKELYEQGNEQVTIYGEAALMYLALIGGESQ